MSMTVGERIKKRRQELGLSVDEVAKKLNKNRATIYRYESDEIENLPISILEPLSKILDVTPAHLMGWEGFNESLIKTHLEGIEYWSNNQFLTQEEREAIKMHFAELLIRYKTLVNEISNNKYSLKEFEKHYKEYNKTLKEPLSENQIKEIFWKDNLNKEVEDIVSWTKAFTSYLSGVYPCK